MPLTNLLGFLNLLCSIFHASCFGLPKIWLFGPYIPGMEETDQVLNWLPADLEDV